MFEVLKSGGLLMIPILFCAVCATFIIIERMIYFHSITKNREKIISDVYIMVKESNYDGAKEYCKALSTPLTLLFKKAIEYRKFPLSEIREAVSNEASMQTPKMEHLLTPLGTIANIATLLGLLGTVTGNIKAFGVLGAGGTMGNPTVLAGSIAEALVTTASGLAVSIPAIIFHNYFVSKVNKELIAIEGTSSELIIRLAIKEKRNEA